MRNTLKNQNKRNVKMFQTSRQQHSKSAYVENLTVQRKENASSSFFSPALSISHSFIGNGQSLPSSTQQFFKAKMGYDFSQVKIHTTKEAASAAEELNADAFTIGNHIAFAEEAYDPASTKGKRLMAHELTHVAQHQNGIASDNQIHRQRSTPVPATAVVDPATDIATFTVNNVNVVVEPDQTLRRGTRVTFHGQRYTVRSRGALTAAYLQPRITPVYTGTGRTKRVRSVTVTYTLYIKTFYGTGASAADPSAYGRGTTAADIAAGNTTLGFHEGSHGQDYQDYIAQHPLPSFALAVPATRAQYNAAMRRFNRALRTYNSGMSAHSQAHTDRVGIPMRP